MDNWALAPLLVRITSPVSTPSWTLAGMAGTLPPLRTSTWPLTRVKRPTTAAWAVNANSETKNTEVNNADNKLTSHLPGSLCGLAV